MLEGEEEGVILLLARSAPLAVVRLPPELGGHEVKVLGHRTIECPKCEDHHEARAHELPDRMLVVECPALGFLWCRLAPAKEGP